MIDVSDAVYSQLRIWVDANGNGVVDAGELETLQQAGIASINLNATAQTNDIVSGNTIAATGTFTFTNGSTGNVDQVEFNVDSYHTQYLGNTSVSTAAAAMPNLKGYGTLTDLQVAMTLDPSLIDVVNATLPNLDVPDLASLRAAATPIFTAWAEAVPLPDADGNPQVIDPAAGNSDVALLISTDADSHTTVYDYAYLKTDGSGNSYWALASGNQVYDADGNIIAEPTFAQVLAQTTTNGQTWIDFTAADIGFVTRFYGQPFQLDELTNDGSTPLDALTDLMDGAMSILNLEAVRLAMQGPLAQYFPDIAYDATTDSFTATTQQQLSPMYEAIFAAAPSDAAGATTWLSDWLPIINIVLGDFARSNGTEVTYGYQFASMVHAYEQSNLPISIEQAAQALGVPAGEVIEGGSTFGGPNSPSIYYLHGGDQTVTAGVGLNNFAHGRHVLRHDTIIDDEPALGPQDESILRFTDAASTDVTATRDAGSTSSSRSTAPTSRSPSRTSSAASSSASTAPISPTIGVSPRSNSPTACSGTCRTSPRRCRGRSRTRRLFSARPAWTCSTAASAATISCPAATAATSTSSASVTATTPSWSTKPIRSITPPITCSSAPAFRSPDLTFSRQERFRTSTS